MSSSQDSQPFHWHYTELDDRNFQIRGRTLFFTVVLFAVVLLVTLFFLYTRWVCRFSHHHDHHHHRSSSSSQPSHAPQQFGVGGLDPTAIETLPVTLHLSSMPPENKYGGGGENDCSICLGEFEDGDKVKILPRCQHSYHCECIDRWLRTRSSCPLCRNSLRVDSVVSSIITQ
ncbi:hypothetical protein ACOSQ2_032583 [Xanthoceras sorbifolium]